LHENSKTGAIIIEGHVQGLAITRALGAEGIPVIVVDKTDCIARYSKYCQKYFTCPNFIDEDFISFLIELKERENLDGWLLLPSNDHAVYNIAQHRDLLELYFKIMTPNLDVIQKIYDKLRLIELAESLQLPTPKTLAGDKNDYKSIEFPVITKGRQGLTFYKKVGKKAVLSSNADELQKNMQRLGERFPLEQTLIQEVIPSDGANKTISFTAFCINGEIKTYWMGVKLREHPYRFGTATFCQSIYQQECYNQSVPLLKKLNYSGVCEIEYLKDPRSGQFKLIEMNPRTWLWVDLAIYCGVNYPLIIFNYLTGQPNFMPDDYLMGVEWRNFFTDFFFSPKDFIKSLTSRNKIIDALWKKNDVLPFFIYAFSLFSYLRKR